MDKMDKLAILAGNNPNFTVEILEIQLAFAEREILNFCHIDSLPAELDYVQIQIALKLLNRMGQEGTNSYAEGGVSQSFDNILTEDIKRQLYAFRKVVF